jgi:hypothetical protein
MGLGRQVCVGFRGYKVRGVLVLGTARSIGGLVNKVLWFLK